MAAPHFPARNQLGIFAFTDDSPGAGDYFFIYVEGISRGEMQAALGRPNKSGTLVDGPVLDAIQAAGSSVDLDLSTATLEYDNDENSPLYGKLRVRITFA